MQGNARGRGAREGKGGREDAEGGVSRVCVRVCAFFEEGGIGSWFVTWASW